MPTRRALVLYAGSEFKGAHDAAVRYLKGKSFVCEAYDIGDWMGNQLSIESYPRTMMRVDATVWLSHGGWDGPFGFSGGAIMGGGQISRTLDAARWPAVCEYFRNMLTADAMAVIHACHSAGSNRYESSEGGLAERWVANLAADVGSIYTCGVEGSTSSAIATQVVALLQHAFEGRSPPQATRVYDSGGRLVVRWPGWLNVPRR
jgi:hypothetical protein